MILFTIRFELLLLIFKIYKILVWTEVLFHENHFLFSNFFLLRRLAALFFKRRLFMQECKRKDSRSLCISLRREFAIYSIMYCVITLQESFKSLAIITTESKTDARIDGTIRVSHKGGDMQIEPKATRQVPVKTF